MWIELRMWKSSVQRNVDRASYVEELRSEKAMDRASYVEELRSEKDPFRETQRNRETHWSDLGVG